MKKKLAIVLAALMSTALVACSREKAEEQKDKFSKNLEKEIEKIGDGISEYIDDETDLGDITKGLTDESSDVTEAPSSSDETPVTVDNGNFDPDLTFKTTDLNGNEITENVFVGHKVTMINFWEPWCGPCVAEMPELEKLYEAYKDQGFQIIGVFSASDQMDEVNQVISDAGITYPIANYVSEFDRFQTGYVPTTIFVDENGKLYPVSNGYGDNVIVGSASYEQWEQTLQELMK
ncbi:MAG: TlpA family protein disulfide reductase [Clostridiales bacterium]|nr:TlpA family protein disulfide reductase [Clostridiales bacterium]MBR5040116.1 TlpA family protein disulfide reductase [Clostridiales bacterium]MBR5059125.1 TlpA family protein disulfide reductase [Clostridiales bacterium]